MKRLLCIFLTMIMLMGMGAAYAATPTDIPGAYPQTSATDLPEETPGEAPAVPEEPDESEVPGGLLIAPNPAASEETDSSDWDKLIAAFLEENNVDPDTVTLGYCNTVTGEEHYFNGDVSMTAASVKKVPLNMYYAEMLHEGKISWDTTYGGLPYSEVQELSLRYSNNEYTDILINTIGTYPEYRRAMCPYIGVDPDQQEFGFFTVNELSAEQAIYCLKLLQAEPGRYPGVIDNMLLAAEGEYFEQLVTGYEIAQKYGWYVVDGHNCINCVGIVETEEPILLAIFTDNCRMGKNILGEYCALMCEYTENDIAARKAAEAERLAAEEEAQRLAEEEAERLAAEEEAQRLALEAEKAQKEEEKAAEEAAVEEEKMNAAENAIRVVACIIACAVLAIALGIVSRKKGKAAEAKAETKTAVIVRNVLAIILGAAAIVAIIFTVNTCRDALDAKPVIMAESSEPSAVAEEFMAHVFSGEAAEAEKMLLGSGKLGLDSEPTDNIGSMLYAALQESFSYAPVGPCTEDSTDASQSFTVTFLDIPSLTALQQDATNARLAQYLEAADRADEVQAEDGSWLPEVAMAALEEVTAELLENAEAHYTEAEVTIQLRFSAGEWKVIAGEDLFAVLSGNTAY